LATSETVWAVWAAAHREHAQPRDSSVTASPRASALVDHRRHGAFIVTLASRLRVITQLAVLPKHKVIGQSQLPARSAARPLAARSRRAPTRRALSSVGGISDQPLHQRAERVARDRGDRREWRDVGQHDGPEERGDLWQPHESDAADYQRQPRQSDCLGNRASRAGVPAERDARLHDKDGGPDNGRPIKLSAHARIVRTHGHANHRAST
jgi:hypothetical protein